MSSSAQMKAMIQEAMSKVVYSCGASKSPTVVPKVDHAAPQQYDDLAKEAESLRRRGVDGRTHSDAAGCLGQRRHALHDLRI